MNTKKIFALTVIFVVGFVLGFSIKSDSRTVAIVENKSQFPLINPTILSDLNKHFIINFKPLRVELEKVQKMYPQKTYVYFLYLNSGSWIGLNERDEFTAASTTKVPLAISLFKAVEEGKINFEDVYTLDASDLDKNFGDLYMVGPGESLTVRELAKIMLEHSDNTAKNALLNSLEQLGIKNPLQPVYESFGWTFDFGENPNFTKINLKTLSNMFLALYNVKYINAANSQQILDYLTNTPFNEKIRDGVPNSILVAHKIGVSKNDETFSDCGIVYAPNRNYILCAGFNGGNEEKANEFMKTISRMVYDYVINN
ncbi:MAG: serine hydrolase [Patescibacteria group bacterium]